MPTKKKSALVLCTSLLSLVISGISVTGPRVVHGEIYKWVDAEGRLHFSDSPIGKAEAVDEELPPASEFISPRPLTPPDPPQQTEPQDETEGLPDAEGTQNTEDTDEPKDIEEEEEIDIGQYGPFGKDGPNGPIGLVDPKAGKNSTEYSEASQKEG
jgi:hypothetical protein